MLSSRLSAYVSKSLPRNGGLRQNWQAALLWSMLLAIPVYTLVCADACFGCAADRLWYLLVVVAGYGAGAMLLRRHTFFIVAGIAQMPVMPIEVSSLYLNGQPVSMPFMHWIISTNRQEVKELLSSLWWFVAIVVLVWGVYILLVVQTVRKKSERESFRQTGNRNKPRWVGTGVWMGIILALLLLHRSHLNKTYTAPNNRVYARVYAWSLGMRVGKVFPYDIYLHTYRAFLHRRETDGMAALSDFRFGIKHVAGNDSCVYVLVIGEAARFHNFSLNGIYSRPTNPLLSQQSQLVFFSEAYAQANATDLSVPLMLTRATADNRERAYREKTVAGAFQEAGFEVTWLSAKSSPIRYLQQVLPTLDKVWIAQGEVMDEALLEPFNETISRQPEKDRLVILQCKGSHLNYQDRYPDRFDRFEPSLKKSIHGKSFNREQLVNTYDNTILYTDYVLSSLIQSLDSMNRCATLIYMPDHGENLCDDERQLRVHGTYEGSEYEYHVPIIVWYSDAFRKAHPAKAAALETNKSKRVTSQVLFHTLCDMAGLEEVTERRYSLCSDSLEAVTDVRVLNGKGEVISGIRQ